MKKKKDLLDSIEKMTVKGNRLELPKDEQFSNYPAVKKCLLTAGGKYGKCGFTFNEDAQSVKDRLLGGELIDDKKKFQFFATPDPLAQQLVEMAEVTEVCRVLEPSAGQGAIANKIPGGCVTVELMEQNITALKRQGYPVIEGDFLQKTVDELGVFDKVIANPPFTKNQDIEHVMHMYLFLKPGGRLVSVASTSWLNGSQKKQVAFREWLSGVGAEVANVDAGAFKSSGTSVATVIIMIDKAA